MRFSLRTMTSGARNSISFLRRLLRLITRRYRSLRSDVAKRPPSRGTSGLSSGGITGITSRIIQSGRFPDFRKLVATFKRFDVHHRQQFLDGFGAHLGDKLCRIVAHQLSIAFVAEQFTLFYSSHVAWIDHDVRLEIKDLLEFAQWDVE